MDAATGKVTAAVLARSDSVHFIELLDQLEASIDPALAIHDLGGAPLAAAFRRLRKRRP